MGKRGPCFHCGINHTPLWRNGPPEKPVLCNACGSRYRIRGTLDKYIPKHLHAHILEKRPGHSPAAGNPTSLDADDISRFSIPPNPTDFPVPPHYSAKSSLIFDEIRSIWKSQIPSKKRTPVVYRGLTSMEKLRQQLLYVLKWEGLSENDQMVIFHNNVNPLIPSNEIGLGCKLLKPHKHMHN